mmetsp:Transcript_41730/g.82382  ORF Transcript_41730/g.82382 Transcript_41730/m.82382 type:complete len:90 (+) Transcript_41730:4531-4800(+)
MTSHRDQPAVFDRPCCGKDFSSFDEKAGATDSLLSLKKPRLRKVGSRIVRPNLYYRSKKICNLPFRPLTESAFSLVSPLKNFRKRGGYR